MSSKKVITPLQKWLLSLGKCVCCGRNLVRVKKMQKNGHYLLTCKCRRVFVWQPKTDKYRRAYLEDL